MASTSANSPKLKAKFKTTLAYATDAASDFIDLGADSGSGATEIAVSLSTAGVITSSWVNIHASAKADVFLGVSQIGGDGSSAPAIGNVELQVR